MLNVRLYLTVMHDQKKVTLKHNQTNSSQTCLKAYAVGYICSPSEHLQSSFYFDMPRLSHHIPPIPSTVYTKLHRKFRTKNKKNYKKLTIKWKLNVLTLGITSSSLAIPLALLFG